MKTEESKSNKRIAFIIWTPFHLFNALRFILSRNLAGKCDAFYVCQSKGMEQYYDALLDEGFFYNIYYTSEEKLRTHQHLWEISSGLFYPTLYVEHMFGRESTWNYYDQIFMSVPTRLNDAIIRSNKCREVVGYDDGTGSYITNLYDYSLGRKYELIKRAISKSPYRITKVYINKPDLIIRDDGVIYEKLLEKDLTDEEKTKVRKIFGHIDNNDLTPAIYLNQPIKELARTQDYIQIEKKVIEILKNELGDKLSVRLHPRERDKDIYKGMAENDNTQMWEIMCDEKEMNERVMISSFSTAQFTPKFLYDKEPWLVFTYNLYKGVFDEKAAGRMYKMVQVLKDTYEDKQKIIVAASEEDLCEKMRMINDTIKSNAID